MNYYNENDPKAAAWLRELIRAGLIPAGDVDERSIIEVRPHELTGYTQQHFFAGIGGWPYALRLAGWPDNRPVRTGSCPCQPFSCAGKGKGVEDERHLWPVFRDLVTFGESTVTFGEQVASAAGREWLAGVRADLEGLGYEVGAADLCAASVGAPHIRQRLYWVAHTNNGRRAAGRREARSHPAALQPGLAGDGLDGLANTAGGRLRIDGSAPREPGHANERVEAERLAVTEQQGWEGQGVPRGPSPPGQTVGSGAVGGMGDATHAESARLGQQQHELHAPPNAWSNFEIVHCSDGKARRFEPGSFPLADGIPGRVVKLRGLGNAIVPPLAAEFIQACVEALNL